MSPMYISYLSSEKFTWKFVKLSHQFHELVLWRNFLVFYVFQNLMSLNEWMFTKIFLARFLSQCHAKSCKQRCLTVNFASFATVVFNLSNNPIQSPILLIHKIDATHHVYWAFQPDHRQDSASSDCKVHSPSSAFDSCHGAIFLRVD